MRITMAADHNGVAFKDHLLEWLTEHRHRTTDIGAWADDGVVDYPPLCAAAAGSVARGAADLAIVIGGSGQGEVVACNKVRGVRAGLAYSEFAVRISRGNNNANVMVVPAMVVTREQALSLLDLWISTPFKGGDHLRRVEQISAIEQHESREPQPRE